MGSQENNQQNDNHLLIDFIKDTYTIESNKHFFVLIPYLIDCITGYEGRFKQSLSANKIGLLSASEQNTQTSDKQTENSSIEYIDKDNILNIDKYNAFNRMNKSLYRFKITDTAKIYTFLSELVCEYKKSFSRLIANQKDYAYLYTLLKNIKETDYSFYIPLLSLYYFDNRVLNQYHDGRKFLNLYIQTYNSLDVFKARKYENTYSDNRFFMWFYIRYYINRTIPDSSLKKLNEQSKYKLIYNIFHYYPRIKESALLGICNKSKLHENKDKVMFNACIDIFQVLNFSFSDLCVGTNLTLGMYKNKEVTCYSIMCDTYGQQVDTLAKTITFSENIKINLLTISDTGGTKQEEENEILDCNSIDTILNPFKDYIVSKIKPKLDEEWQDYIDTLEITNIFSTINPNFYSFKMGVNKYQSEYYEERVVLLFVKLNNIIQMRFDDILESGAKIVFVFYGYNEADDKNYISKHGKEPNYTINFSGMRNDNVRFIYYDEEDNKFTLLSGELKETGNNGDNNIYFFESSDFSAQFSLVSSYLKFYIDKFQFLFLSYKDIHSDNNTKGAGNITCISEECANQEVSTKQCEGEIKVSLTLTGKKETISQLKDLPVYMYIDYSKEIIDSTITLQNEETAKAEFGFKTESKSNLILKFSFYRSIYNTIKTVGEKETISDTLYLNKVYNGSYNINKPFNEKYFPDIIEIIGIKLLSYNDKSLEILLLSNVKNTDKKSTEILKYIKWKFFVTDNVVDDRAVEKTAGLSNKSITIYDLDDKIYNNSIVSGNKLQLYYTDKFLELYNTVIQNQNSSKSLVLYPYIAYSELNINKQNEEYLKHALVIRNSGINKFTGVLSVTISEVNSDEYGIYTELEAHHNSKLVSPQINDVKWGYLILDKACIVFDKAKIVPMEQYGKTIKVYYNEEWYNKYLYFFPYYKSVDINLYSLWHIEQPVSLKFNGEKLQILEEGKVLKEYEARSGIAVNKRADRSNNTQEVPYPLESLDKYFYYDEQSTSKILEGEYYIIEEALEANSAELVGELYSGLYKNSLGSRYMDLYKSSDVSFINIAHFNQMILERKNYFFKSDTLNKIHGGIDYEDKGGIDLSTGADEFFKDLTKIIKDKPLYKVSGKIPIKLEVDYRRFYIDEDGYIQGAGLSYYHLKNELAHKIEQGEINKVKGIVLHRTNGPSASSAMNWWYQSKSNVGTHFVIDKDGTIYQTASLLRYTYHHNNHRPGVTIRNNNSIGIEVAAKYIETQRIWEPATENQLISIRFLIHILLDLYKLSENDIFEHDKISYKTDGEGEGLYEKNN